MKRLLILSLAALLSAPLAGCGSCRWFNRSDDCDVCQPCDPCGTMGDTYGGTPGLMGPVVTPAPDVYTPVN